MKQRYEGQGLERLFRALWVFAAIGVTCAVALLAWVGGYVLWRVFV
jgi:fatty acid desaturase